MKLAAPQSGVRLGYRVGCEHLLGSCSCLLPLDSEFALTGGCGRSVVVVAALAAGLQCLGSEDT